MKHGIFWIFVCLVWFGQILCHVLKCFKMPMVILYIGELCCDSCQGSTWHQWVEFPRVCELG